MAVSTLTTAQNDADATSTAAAYATTTTAAASSPSSTAASSSAVVHVVAAAAAAAAAKLLRLPDMITTVLISTRGILLLSPKQNEHVFLPR